MQNVRHHTNAYLADAIAELGVFVEQTTLRGRWETSTRVLQKVWKAKNRCHSMFRCGGSGVCKVFNVLLDIYVALCVFWGGKTQTPRASIEWKMSLANIHLQLRRRGRYICFSPCRAQHYVILYS